MVVVIVKSAVGQDPNENPPLPLPWSTWTRCFTSLTLSSSDYKMRVLPVSGGSHQISCCLGMECGSDPRACVLHCHPRNWNSVPTARSRGLCLLTLVPSLLHELLSQATDPLQTSLLGEPFVQWFHLFNSTFLPVVLSGGSALAQGEDGRLAEMHLRDKQAYSAGGNSAVPASRLFPRYPGFRAGAARSHFQVSAPEWPVRSFPVRKSLIPWETGG